MKIKPGDLVVYKDFYSNMGRTQGAMIVIDKLSRLKNEGCYYRVVDRGQLTICHSSQIRKVKKNEDI